MTFDGLSIITTEVSNTSFRVTPTTIGGVNFFGNSIVYPPSAKAGENCLFGTKAMIPIDGPVREGIGLWVRLPSRSLARCSAMPLSTS